MPPLQTPGIASMTPGTGGGGRFTGRMHAAPTNRPGTAGKTTKRISATSLCAEGKNRTKTAHLFNVKICPARRQKPTPHRANCSAAARGAAFTKISLADPLDAGRPACYTYGAHQKNGAPGRCKSTNNGTAKRPAPPCRKNRLSTALSLFLLPSLYPNLPT